MTIIDPAPQALPGDGFQLVAVDFPGRCHLEHGELPAWATPSDHPTERTSRGGDR
ncbi:hypothetical protein ACFXO9_04895 [Nocardia tengchongensis]|uniref:hypothetical protein n=1 Tax=Nocardia tengchongensis TaxID=2055889 RepID=UPI003616D522